MNEAFGGDTRDCGRLDGMLSPAEKFAAVKFEHWSGETGVPHSHDFFEIVYVADGCAIHTVGDEQFSISKGDYFIIDCGVRHMYSGNIKVLNFAFYPEFLDPELEGIRNFAQTVSSRLIGFGGAEFCGSLTENMFRDEDGSLAAVFEEMYAEYTEKQPGFDGIIRSLLVKVLILALRNVYSRTDKTDKKIVRELIRYIRDNVTSEISLAAFAAEKYYNPSYLSRAFHAGTGVTFSKYVQRAKLDEACRMLAHTSLSVTEIRSLLKYGDAKHFYTIFREYTSATPTEYRRRCAENKSEVIL